MQAQGVICSDQVRGFIESSERTLVVMGEAVSRLTENPGDPGFLGILLQRARGLEGEARSQGFPELAEVTGELQDILERVLSGSIAVGRDVTEVLVLSMEVLRELLSEAGR